MSEDDLELERLKAKRLAEMQQNISTLTQSKAPEPEKKEKPNPRNIVLKSLGFRGQEVLETAESQFPNETSIIVGQLAQLITSGELNETIDASWAATSRPARTTPRRPAGRSTR